MKRISLHRAASLFIGLALLAAPACSTSPESPDKHSTHALQEDLDALYAGLRNAHFDLYAHRDQAEYDAFYTQMRDGLTAPLSTEEAEVRFQKFSAFGNVAHSNIAFPSDAWETFRLGGGKAFPLAIRYMDDRLMITGDRTGTDQALPGARILSINGVGAGEVEARLRQHISADNDYLARTILEFRFTPVLWLEFGAPEEFTLIVKDAAGVHRTVTVPAMARDDLVMETEGGALFELDWNERRYEIRDSIGYLRPGPFYNNDPEATDVWDNGSFTAFIDEAFTSFSGADVPAVLIDIRANPGGDNSFSDHMLAWFADRPFRFASHFYIRVSEETTASNAKRLSAGDTESISARMAKAYAALRPGEVIDFDLGNTPPREGEQYKGRVYVLIDRHSYSNTVTVAALLQDYGYATVLGEETSDLATTYGALEQFQLPNTGITVNYPKAHIIRPNGDMAARGVIPDVQIPSPLLPAYDEQLEKALSVIHEELGL